MERPILLGLMLQKRRCLVCGDDAEAEEVANRLRQAGGEVLRQAAACEPLDASLDLIFAMLADDAGNQSIATIAHGYGIPVYVRNLPALSTLHLPAYLAAGDADVAVQHPLPVIRSDLMVRLRAALPHRYGLLTRWVRDRQQQVARALPGSSLSERFWAEALAGPMAEQVLSGHAREADKALAGHLANGQVPRGEVYLIGAGPGDPDLLTLRALRLLRQADVVLYDRLVAPAILDLIPAHAQRLYVGKQRDDHPVPQDEINQLLRRLAADGKRVARLKGGDPFIFGRGGEEIEQLMADGIPFQVVPGITAANGCAAYAGIPLTHRDYAQSCVFVTGHRREGGLGLDFETLVRPGQTVICYMGLHTLELLCQGLIAAGMPASMPAALVEQGTTDSQRVLVATVADLPARAREASVRAPTLAIIGDVVRLREKLDWFHGSGREDGFRSAW